MQQRSPILAALAIALFAAAPSVRADDLSSRLPPDLLGFIEVNGETAPASGGSGALMDMGFEALRSLGVLPRDVTAAGDALGLAAMAGGRHFCIGWLDADLRPGAHDGLVCKSVQLVWLVDTHGRPEEMLRRITALLDHYATKETSHQSVRKSANSGREFVEFSDARWPAWIKLGWLQEKDVFVLAMGDGAMEHYLAGQNVEGLRWADMIKQVDEQSARDGRTGDAFARIYVRTAAFNEKFPDAVKRTLLGRVLTALRVADAGQALFSARRHGREVSMDYGVDRAGKTTVTPWTVPLAADSPLLKAVPAEATSYLAIHIDWPEFYTQMTAVLDAILTDEGEISVDAKVQRFAKRLGVNLNDDVLKNAEPVILVHDWPQHPLGLPLMVTAIACATPTGAAQVKSETNKLLADAQGALDRRKNGFFRLRTGKDGVMYMQFGIVGPAWGWSGDKLVWSWSPAAVHANLDAAAAIPDAAFAAPPLAATRR